MHAFHHFFSEKVLLGGICTGMCCHDVACTSDKGDMGEMMSLASRFVQLDDLWLDVGKIVKVLCASVTLCITEVQVRDFSCLISIVYLCLRCLSAGQFFFFVCLGVL
jgi:hypothetical protein